MPVRWGLIGATVIAREWMIDAIRNLAVYPNLLLMDQSSTTIRVVRPLSVDRTQMEVYCVAPRGDEC